MDFFHLCEYLSAASKVGAANDPRAWLEAQKGRLKAHQSSAVLEALASFVEANSDDSVTVLIAISATAWINWTTKV